MIKDPSQIIEELLKEVHHLQGLIKSKDVIIQNYQMIVQGYKDILSSQDQKILSLSEATQNILELVEIDFKNPKSVMNAFLIVQRQNQKLTKIIQDFKESTQIIKRLN